MTASNDTQRVLLSEQFEDDLYYSATVRLERTEVCFNRDSVVFVKLASDQAPVRLSLTAGEIDTFIEAYTAYQHAHTAERALPDAGAFRAWLEERENQVAGTSQIGREHPLARWLTALYGTTYSISLKHYGPIEGEEGSALASTSPWWMQAFVEQLSREHRGAVTGAQALLALDTICADDLDDLESHPF